MILVSLNTSKKIWSVHMIGQNNMSGNYILAEDYDMLNEKCLANRPVLSNITTLQKNRTDLKKNILSSPDRKKSYFTVEGNEILIRKTVIIGKGRFKKVYPALFCPKSLEDKKVEKNKEVVFAKFITVKQESFTADKKSHLSKRRLQISDRECYILTKLQKLFPRGCRGLVKLLAKCEWKKNEVTRNGFVFFRCNGGTLEDSRMINLQEAYKIALDVAYGLKALHAQFILHNDLKPSNICLQRNIENNRIISAHIIDFGLASDLLEIKHAFPLDSDIICASPELIYGIRNPSHSNSIDKQSDIFSYGKILKRFEFKYEPLCKLIKQSQKVSPQERPTILDFISVIEEAQKKLQNKI